MGATRWDFDGHEHFELGYRVSHTKRNTQAFPRFSNTSDRQEKVLSFQLSRDSFMIVECLLKWRELFQ